MNKLTKFFIILIVGLISSFFYYKDELKAENNPKENALLLEKNKADSKHTSPSTSKKRKELKLEIPERMKHTPERIISHTGYTLSFNREHNSPNWVAWELTAEETNGHVSRSNEFLPDPDIPAPHRVTTADYKNSGYDRGHMVPAADMKWSGKAMTECFYMSNICPQEHTLNSGSWASLENACRRWAEQEGSVYIICGPIYQSKKPKTIGKEYKISVPDGFFKAVLSMRKGHEKAIAFYFANNKSKQHLAQAAISVDELEELTGIDLFVNLPDKQEADLESTFSLKDWN